MLPSGVIAIPEGLLKYWLVISWTNWPLSVNTLILLLYLSATTYFPSSPKVKDIGWHLALSLYVLLLKECNSLYFSSNRADSSFVIKFSTEEMLLGGCLSGESRGLRGRSPCTFDFIWVYRLRNIKSLNIKFSQ